MLEKEMIEMAKTYKRKVASAFVLVDGNEIKNKITGTNFVATKKMDGSLQSVFFGDGDICGISSSGIIVRDLPCLKEAAALLKEYGLKSAVIEAELYAVLENGKRERVGDVAKALADKELWNSLYLAPFDIVSLDDEKYQSQSYNETIKKLYAMLTGKLVKPVEYRELYEVSELVSLYDEWVLKDGAEGIVLHSESPITYKIKPRHNLDAVIVGYTVGDGENRNRIRDVAIAVMNQSGVLQLVGTVGNGFTSGQRDSILKQLETAHCESEYILTDNRGIAFQMVEPKMVVELEAGDYVIENSDGISKQNPLISFKDGKYVWEGNTNGVAIQHLVFVRVRDDKSVNDSDIRISQITDICPLKEDKVADLTNLAKSEVLVRRVFTKGTGEKLMIQKYLIWKTNKEETGMYPAYVVFYTDFSSSRKDMIKRDLRVTSDKEQAVTLLEEMIAENVKKGWNEVK